MNKKLIYISLLSSSLLLGNSLSAAPTGWQSSEVDTSFASRQAVDAPEGSILKARKLEINISDLSTQLTGSSNLSARASKTRATIAIPLPDGGQVQVKAEEVSVMAPELAEKYPQIKTWRVVGKNDSTIHGRIDITEHGFHAMLKMADGDTIFVEPDKTAENQYLSFSQRANPESFNNYFQCGVKADANSALSFADTFLNNKQDQFARTSSARLAWQKKTYRLAVAATGEYTKFHGGTKSKGLSAIVTTINRVNEIFETDLSIKLELIGSEESIIYTNPNTDPYTNNDTEALLEQNLYNLSDGGTIPTSSYDIGHVFGTTGDLGGLAQLGSVCDTELKAGGATGIANPIGDAFSISYVAHEMGHQLGATHTFNSSCSNNRQPETAVEPGSGSTIMSYAGVCGATDADDLQAESDPQFHAGSIIQIDEFVRNQGGSSCGSLAAVTNQDPEINAGADYTIPTRTPFTLTAAGSDTDGDTISYTWEQFDIGTESPVDVDTGDNAIFRSRPKSISPSRSIPRLSDLANGVSVKGERIAANDRDVSFIVTARDGKGGVSFDEMKLNLKSTGRAFSVTSHSVEETLEKGSSTKVTWDVAGTDSAPISCAKVNIWLIEPNGDDVKLITTANDGQESVTIPEGAADTDSGRILVACANNIFYNISSANLKVTKAAPPATSGGSGGGSMAYILLALFALGVKKMRRGAKR